MARRRTSWRSWLPFIGNGEKDADTELDVSYITERIIASGCPWRAVTSRKSHRNNVDDLVAFLEEKHAGKYMVFNLGYEHLEKADGQYRGDSYAFHGQVLEFPPYFNDTHSNKEDVPAVEQLYALIYTLKFWLDWDPEHVAVLTCSSGGRLRTGFVVACYLTYCGLQPDTIDAFRFFLKQRSGSPDDTITMMRSWRAALINMNTMLRLEPRLPRVLLLSKLIFMLPGPIAESPEPPTVEIYQDEDCVLDTSDDGVDVEWMGGTLAVVVNRIICCDIQIRVTSYERTDDELTPSRRLTRTASTLSDDGDEPTPRLRNRMVARCAFHTSQFPAGALVVGHERLDIFTTSLVDANDVELQLILHDAPAAEVARMKAANELKDDQIANLTGARAQSVGAKHFTTHHYIFPEASCFNSLLSEGHEETVAVAALQRTENDLDGARELLKSKYLVLVASYAADTTDTDCTSPPTNDDLSFAMKTAKHDLAERVRTSSADRIGRIIDGEDEESEDEDTGPRLPESRPWPTTPDHARSAHRPGHVRLPSSSTPTGFRERSVSSPYEPHVPEDDHGLKLLADFAVEAQSGDQDAFRRLISSLYATGQTATTPTSMPATPVDGAIPFAFDGSPERAGAPARLTDGLRPPMFGMGHRGPGDSSALSGRGRPDGGVGFGTGDGGGPGEGPLGPGLGFGDGSRGLGLGKGKGFGPGDGGGPGEGPLGPGQGHGDGTNGPGLGKGKGFGPGDGGGPGEGPLGPGLGFGDGSRGPGLGKGKGFGPGDGGGPGNGPLRPGQGHGDGTNGPGLGKGKGFGPGDGGGPGNGPLGPGQGHGDGTNGPGLGKGKGFGPGDGGGPGNGPLGPGQGHGDGTNGPGLGGDLNAVPGGLVVQQIAKLLAEQPHVDPQTLLENVEKFLKFPGSEPAAGAGGAASTAPDGKAPPPGDKPAADKPKPVEESKPEKPAEEPKPEKPAGVAEAGAAEGTSAGGPPALKNDPRFAAYFKMLKAGVPPPAVQHKMQMDGLNPEILDCDHNTPLPDKFKPPPPLKDDPTFAAYFKMLKAGVPKEAVKHKMQMDGIDPDIMDCDHDKPLPDKFKDDSPPLKEDAKFLPYLKMLKAGVPKDAVKHKMQMDGLEPEILECDPELPLPKKYRAPEPKGPPIRDDPKLAAYFKMLKAGVPAEAVKHKMRMDGVQPDILDCDPDKPLPQRFRDEGEEFVSAAPLKDDPKYAMYFRMLSAGVPKEAVAHKMTMDGLDPALLDEDPDKPMKKKFTEAFKKEKATRGKAKLARDTGPRLVRVHGINAIDEDLLTDDMLWLNEDTQLVIDEANFLETFTVKPTKPKQSKGAKAAAAAKAKPSFMNSKRSHLVSIAVKAIKIPYEAVRDCLSSLSRVSGEHFLEDRALEALANAMPSDQEVRAAKKFNGDASQLTEAERFVLAIAGVPQLQERAEAMLFQLRFPSKYSDIVKRVEAIQSTCKALQEEKRLPVVLRAVVQIGNRLLKQQHKAMTLESLTKLAQTKGADKKTTVMLFALRILQSQSPDALNLATSFPDVRVAAKLDFDEIDGDVTTLNKELKTVATLVRAQSKVDGGWARLRTGGSAASTPRSPAPGTPSRGDAPMTPQAGAGLAEPGSPATPGAAGVAVDTSAGPEADGAGAGAGDEPAASPLSGHVPIFLFATEAQSLILAVRKRLEVAQDEFEKLQTFFGENTDARTVDFFAALSKFQAVFKEAHAVLERDNYAKRVEDRKRAASSTSKPSPAPKPVAATAKTPGGGDGDGSETPVVPQPVPPASTPPPKPADNDISMDTPDTPYRGGLTDPRASAARFGLSRDGGDGPTKLNKGDSRANMLAEMMAKRGVAAPPAASAAAPPAPDRGALMAALNSRKPTDDGNDDKPAPSKLGSGDSRSAMLAEMMAKRGVAAPPAAAPPVAAAAAAPPAPDRGALMAALNSRKPTDDDDDDKPAPSKLVAGDTRGAMLAELLAKRSSS